MSRSAVVSSSTRIVPARSAACRMVARSSAPHRAARRVLEVGHEVGQHRQRSREGLLGAVQVPPLVGRHRHADQAGVRSPERICGVRIGGRLDEHAIAAAEQHGGEQMDRALRARGHHDLARPGRDAALAVACGDRLAQLDPPEHVVADARDDRRGGLRDLGHHPGQSRPRGWTGLLQVDGALDGRSAPGIAATQRQCHAARPAGAGDVARVAKAPVRRGDRAPADVQRRGELPLRGQCGARSEAIVQAQQSDAVGQRLVCGLARAPAAERGRQRAGRDAGIHEARIAELDCTMRANYAIGWCMTRRILQLLVGLVLYGAGCALTVEAGWASTRGPCSRRASRSTPGSASAGSPTSSASSCCCCGSRSGRSPGIGTIANILLVGTSMQVVLWLVPPDHGSRCADRRAARRHPARRDRLGSLHRRAVRPRTPRRPDDRSQRAPRLAHLGLPRARRGLGARDRLGCSAARSASAPSCSRPSSDRSCTSRCRCSTPRRSSAGAGRASGERARDGRARLTLLSARGTPASRSRASSGSAGRSSRSPSRGSCPPTLGARHRHGVAVVVLADAADDAGAAVGHPEAWCVSVVLIIESPSDASRRRRVRRGAPRCARAARVAVEPVPPTGLEPVTGGLEGRCSIH